MTAADYETECALASSEQPCGSAKQHGGHCFHIRRGPFRGHSLQPNRQTQRAQFLSRSKEGALGEEPAKTGAVWFTILAFFSAVHPSQHSTDFQQRKHLLGSSAVSFGSEQTFDKRLTKQSACHPAPLSKFQQGAGTCFCGYSRWDICSRVFAQCSLAAVIVALILSATGCFLSFHRASISLSGFVLRFF